MSGYGAYYGQQGPSYGAAPFAPPPYHQPYGVYGGPAAAQGYGGGYAPQAPPGHPHLPPPPQLPQAHLPPQPLYHHQQLPHPQYQQALPPRGPTGSGPEEEWLETHWAWHFERARGPMPTPTRKLKLFARNRQRDQASAAKAIRRNLFRDVFHRPPEPPKESFEEAEAGLAKARAAEASDEERYQAALRQLETQRLAEEAKTRPRTKAKPRRKARGRPNAPPADASPTRAPVAEDCGAGPSEEGKADELVPLSPEARVLRPRPAKPSDAASQATKAAEEEAPLLSEEEEPTSSQPSSPAVKEEPAEGLGLLSTTAVTELAAVDSRDSTATASSLTQLSIVSEGEEDLVPEGDASGLQPTPDVSEAPEPPEASQSSEEAQATSSAASTASSKPEPEAASPAVPPEPAQTEEPTQPPTAPAPVPQPPTLTKAPLKPLPSGKTGKSGRGKKKKRRVERLDLNSTVATELELAEAAEKPVVQRPASAETKLPSPLKAPSPPLAEPASATRAQPSGAASLPPFTVPMETKPVSPLTSRASASSGEPSAKSSSVDGPLLSSQDAAKNSESHAGQSSETSATEKPAQSASVPPPQQGSSGSEASAQPESKAAPETPLDSAAKTPAPSSAPAAKQAGGKKKNKKKKVFKAKPLGVAALPPAAAVPTPVTKAPTPPPAPEHSYTAAIQTEVEAMPKQVSEPAKPALPLPSASEESSESSAAREADAPHSAPTAPAAQPKPAVDAPPAGKPKAEAKLTKQSLLSIIRATPNHKAKPPPAAMPEEAPAQSHQRADVGGSGATATGQPSQAATQEAPKPEASKLATPAPPGSSEVPFSQASAPLLPEASAKPTVEPPRPEPRPSLAAPKTTAKQKKAAAKKAAKAAKAAQKLHRQTLEAPGKGDAKLSTAAQPPSRPVPPSEPFAKAPAALSKEPAEELKPACSAPEPSQAEPPKAAAEQTEASDAPFTCPPEEASEGALEAPAQSVESLDETCDLPPTVLIEEGEGEASKTAETPPKPAAEPATEKGTEKPLSPLRAPPLQPLRTPKAKDAHPSKLRPMQAASARKAAKAGALGTKRKPVPLGVDAAPLGNLLGSRSAVKAPPLPLPKKASALGTAKPPPPAQAQPAQEAKASGLPKGAQEAAKPQPLSSQPPPTEGEAGQGSSAKEPEAANSQPPVPFAKPAAPPPKHRKRKRSAEASEKRPAGESVAPAPASGTPAATAAESQAPPLPPSIQPEGPSKAAKESEAKEATPTEPPKAPPAKPSVTRTLLDRLRTQSSLGHRSELSTPAKTDRKSPLPSTPRPASVASNKTKRPEVSTNSPAFQTFLRQVLRMLQPLDRLLLNHLKGAINTSKDREKEFGFSRKTTEDKSWVEFIRSMINSQIVTKQRREAAAVGSEKKPPQYILKGKRFEAAVSQCLGAPPPAKKPRKDDTLAKAPVSAPLKLPSLDTSQPSARRSASVASRLFSASTKKGGKPSRPSVFAKLPPPPPAEAAQPSSAELASVAEASAEKTITEKPAAEETAASESPSEAMAPIGEAGSTTAAPVPAEEAPVAAEEPKASEEQSASATPPSLEKSPLSGKSSSAHSLSLESLSSVPRSSGKPASDTSLNHSSPRGEMVELQASLTAAGSSARRALPPPAPDHVELQGPDGALSAANLSIDSEPATTPKTSPVAKGRELRGQLLLKAPDSVPKPSSETAARSEVKPVSEAMATAEPKGREPKTAKAKAPPALMEISLPVLPSDELLYGSLKTNLKDSKAETVTCRLCKTFSADPQHIAAMAYHVSSHAVLTSGKLICLDCKAETVFHRGMVARHASGCPGRLNFYDARVEMAWKCFPGPRPVNQPKPRKPLHHSASSVPQSIFGSRHPQKRLAGLPPMEPVRKTAVLPPATSKVPPKTPVEKSQSMAEMRAKALVASQKKEAGMSLRPPLPKGAPPPGAAAKAPPGQRLAMGRAPTQPPPAVQPHFRAAPLNPSAAWHSRPTPGQLPVGGGPVSGQQRRLPSATPNGKASASRPSAAARLPSTVAKGEAGQRIPAYLVHPNHIPPVSQVPAQSFAGAAGRKRAAPLQQALAAPPPAAKASKMVAMNFMPILPKAAPRQPPAKANGQPQKGAKTQTKAPTKATGKAPAKPPPARKAPKPPAAPKDGHLLPATKKALNFLEGKAADCGDQWELALDKVSRPLGPAKRGCDFCSAVFNCPGAKTPKARVGAFRLKVRDHLKAHQKALK